MIALFRFLSQITRERILFASLLAVYVFVGTHLPGVNSVERTLMTPLFTVHDSVTAQFDTIFSDRGADVVVEEVAVEHTGPDFTQRFAQALVKHRSHMVESCKPEVKAGASSLDHALMRLGTYCLVDDALKYATTDDYGKIMVSKGELLQYITQLELLHTGQLVDVYGYQEGKIKYTDVKQDRWYTPYVYAADAMGLLEDIGSGKVFSKKLQPLGPVGWDEFEIILKNAGHELPTSLSSRLGGTEYLTKETMLRFLNILYNEKLESADVMYGSNMVFYEWIIKKTMTKTPQQQQAFVQEFIDSFGGLTGWALDKKYNVDTQEMIAFLESFLIDASVE